LLLSCAIADFFRVVIFACHYSRATRPALSQQSGVSPFHTTQWRVSSTLRLPPPVRRHCMEGAAPAIQSKAWILLKA
jgi:hypothetical protein